MHCQLDWLYLWRRACSVKGAVKHKNISRVQLNIFPAVFGMPRQLPRQHTCNANN